MIKTIADNVETGRRAGIDKVHRMIKYTYGAKRKSDSDDIGLTGGSVIYNLRDTLTDDM